MRRTMILMLTASVGVALACSDGSPTGPSMGGTAASAESTESPALKTVGHNRNVVVVPARSDKTLSPGVWGSDQANLTIRDGSATLEILSSAFPSGGCFGRFGDMGKIPIRGFSMPGTYTQLMGAYPGRVVYAAQYSGVVDGNTMSLTITVPALQQDFGPFVLVQGVTNSWTPCLYP